MKNFGKRDRNRFSKENRRDGRQDERKENTSRYPDRSGNKKTYKGKPGDEKPRFGPASGQKKEFRKNQEVSQRRGSRFVSDQREKKPEYDLRAVQKGNQPEEIRLNKYIANAGICSRREADVLIEKGEVAVNGKVITELGYKVNKKDKVEFKGKVLNPEKPVYLLLNKPKDYITTTDDPFERKTVMRLVESACEERIFPVGRLDRNTTGLLLFTNDGELSDKLTHPSNEVKKIYQVTLDKPLAKNDLESIMEGVELEDGKAEVDDLQILSKDKTILGLEIHSGKNRIVRRIFAHFGYEVIGLDRVMFAGLSKKDISRGRYRFLTEKEVINLKYMNRNKNKKRS